MWPPSLPHSDIAYRAKNVRTRDVQMFIPTRTRNVVIGLLIFTSGLLSTDVVNIAVLYSAAYARNS